jgi:hypothetical protein
MLIFKISDNQLYVGSVRCVVCRRLIVNYDRWQKLIPVITFLRQRRLIVNYDRWQKLIPVITFLSRRRLIVNYDRWQKSHNVVSSTL